MEEYITQFDELRNVVMSLEGHLKESYYTDTFISGLKEELAQALYNNIHVLYRRQEIWTWGKNICLMY